MENKPLIWTFTWWKFKASPTRVFFLTGFVKTVSEAQEELVELYELGMTEPVRPYQKLADFTKMVEDGLLLPVRKT